LRRYYLETYGCAANQADSAIMRGILEGAGFEAAASPEESDVVLINTCGVKSPTEDKIIDRLAELSRSGRPLVVAGCLTLINWRRLVRAADFGAALTPRSVHRVLEAVELAAADPRGRALLDSEGPPEKPDLSIPEGLVGTVEIEDGCTFSCSFCATKLSRGTTHSYSARSIVEAVRRMVRAGAREIRLTGQDVASYRDGAGGAELDLVGLVELIDSEVEGDYRLRIGMMTPVLAWRLSGRLPELYGRARVYKFAHIPVQSGSDRVLRLMRRGHGADLFLELVRRLRSRVPMLTLETDVIVGHPGEDEEDFRMTLDLLRATEPDVVNLSKYSNRPGTEASRMEQLPSQVVAERSREAHREVMRMMEKRNSRWMGWRGRALVLERGTRPGTMIARNDWYKPIVIGGGARLLGRWIEVSVDGYTPVHLNGIVLSEDVSDRERIEDGVSGQAGAPRRARAVDRGRGHTGGGRQGAGGGAQGGRGPLGVRPRGPGQGRRPAGVRERPHARGDVAPQGLRGRAPPPRVAGARVEHRGGDGPGVDILGKLGGRRGAAGLRNHLVH